MIARALAAVGVAASLAACGGGSVGTVRYRNQPPVWRVNDRVDVPVPPKRLKYYDYVEFSEGLVFRRITYAMEVPEPRRALDVNSLGEVPDSTWFTNRIGVRDVTVEDLRRGPNGAGPDLSEPLRVVSAKRKGKLPGVIAEDRTGTRYIVKLDNKGSPMVESATDVIVQRLLWACGYNVPENFVVYFRRDQIAVADDAIIEAGSGERRMTERDLDAVLASTDPRPDGRYRALASKYLPGKPLGGFPPEGVREDDPNDVIPHEHRRSLRGLYVIFSWLQHSDVKPDNTLDMWVEDDRGRHYVRHYLVDFGKSFGAYVPEGTPSEGHAERYDIRYILLSAVTFGLWKRPWEGTRDPDIEGVAVFDAEHFHPGRWIQGWPWHPFRARDVYDMLWGAKIVMRFTPELIRTAVEQGQFEDEAAVEYLTEVLIGRQRKVGRYWLSRVNPLDGFRLEDGDRLCFRDLYVDHGFAGDATTRYRLRAFDFDGESLGWRVETRATCANGIPIADSHHGYTIIQIETLRGQDLQPVEVHLARDARGEPRIIGVNRR